MLLVHYFITLVHVTCGFFWLGWMVYFSLFVVPLLKAVVPGDFLKLRAHLQKRTRTVTYVLIVLIVLTGIHNMAYNGLLDLRILFSTPTGLRLVLKIVLAFGLFGFYLAAPRFTSGIEKTDSDDRSVSRESGTDSGRTVFLIIHNIALAVGLFVAYPGISIGG